MNRIEFRFGLHLGEDQMVVAVWINRSGIINRSPLGSLPPQKRGEARRHQAGTENVGDVNRGCSDRSISD